MNGCKLKKLIFILGIILCMVILVVYWIQLPKKSEKETTSVVKESEEAAGDSQQTGGTQKREKAVDVDEKEIPAPQFDYQALNKDLFGQNSLQWFEIQLFSESVKGEFTEVQKGNSMFPEELVSEFENMIYQSFDDSLQKYTLEEVRKSSYFEITDKFGASDFELSIEEMRKLFPELEDVETETEAYQKFSGSENCFDMFHFHMNTDQDNYLFVIDSGGSAGTIYIRLTRFEQGEFVTICEFPVQNSGYGRVIRYDEDFYYVFVARNYNIKNFDGVHIHKLGVNAREENLVIKYLPTEYAWKNVYMRAGIEELDTYLESIKDEITSDEYMENGKEEDIGIYYGDETAFVLNSGEPFLDDEYYKVDFLNIGNPVYIKKSNYTPYGSNSTHGMWFLKCNFKMQNLENNTMVELDNMKIGEYIPSDSDPILVQMWFKESKDKVYTFCLYYVCDYNYVLNVLLMEGDEVSRVRTDLISPKREFVLTEREIFHDM